MTGDDVLITGHEVVCRRRHRTDYSALHRHNYFDPVFFVRVGLLHVACGNPLPLLKQLPNFGIRSVVVFPAPHFGQFNVFIRSHKSQRQRTRWQIWQQEATVYRSDD